MELLGRFLSSVNVKQLLALHKALFMVEGSLNDTISDGFGNNVFRRLFRVEIQTEANLAERDAGIGQGHGSDTSLDDGLTKTNDEGVGSILLESITILVNDFVKGIEFANSNSLDEEEIWLEGLLEHGVSEEGAVWNVSHQQFDDNVQFVGCLYETCCCWGLWCLANGTLEMLMGGRVVELNGSDLSEVIFVTDDEVVCGGWWECCFGNEKVGLVDVIGDKVVSE